MQYIYFETKKMLIYDKNILFSLFNKKEKIYRLEKLTT